MKFNDYQLAIEQFAKYPESGTGSILAKAYVMMGLFGESGELAEKLKKHMRGDELYQDKNQLEDMLIGELGDVLWYLTRICEEFDISLEDVAEVNIAKLQSRLERNLIKGDGDNR